MGSNLLKTKKNLGITNESSYFNVNGEQIFFFADSPHLRKATRNMLFKNKLVDSATKDSSTWNLIRPENQQATYPLNLSPQFDPEFFEIETNDN